MYQLNVVPCMRSAFTEGECMINGCLSWLHPFVADGACSLGELIELGQRNRVVTFHTQRLSPVSLSKADLTTLVPFPDIF